MLARHLLWNPLGPITGTFDSGLEAAVKSFQQSKGLTVDGIVGDDTWFVWMTPGSAQQLTLEGASGLTNGLL